MDPSSTNMLQSKRFIAHAARLIQTLDTTINMLGPDIEMLTEVMFELGEKHVRFGVTSQMFPIMGQCLLETIDECLQMEMKAGSRFIYTKEMKDAWVEVYLALSKDMIHARKMTFSTLHKKKKITTSNYQL
jgi:hemoglobin-like flavoprotein